MRVGTSWRVVLEPTLMTDLFSRGELREFMDSRVRWGTDRLDHVSEDEVLSRSTDDLVEELARLVRLEPLVIGDDPVDGGVAEGSQQVQDSWGGGTVRQPVFNVHAVYEFTGDAELLQYSPSTRLLTRITADIGAMTLTVRTTMSAQQPVDESAVRQSYEREIGNIRTNAGHSTNDVSQFNASLDQRIRPAVERRKELLQRRRSLAGALGFPLIKRTDAPARVPIERKQLSSSRVVAPKPRQPYRDEPALNTAQYEEVIGVVESTMLAMERTPSVASGKDEEELRDQFLVQLNGAFKGSATGETFVQRGKTDLLVRMDNRHVFVGECKWWTGEKSFGEAIGQLLGYLPWRDEKAALILFVGRRDASAVIEKADQAIRSHPAFKRAGAASSDRARRRNFVLGQPDDPEREIHLAALFAVLPRDAVKAAGGKAGSSA